MEWNRVGDNPEITLPISPLTCKAPKTTIAEFANTIDPDETAHNETSHLDLQCLSLIFQCNTVYIERFSKFCRLNFVLCFFFGTIRVKS